MSTRRDRILVVDDDPLLRNVVSRILDADGFEVTEAADAFEALRAFNRRLYDETLEFVLVVTDIVMPDITGVDLFWILQAAAPDLPVVLMSGYGRGLLAEQQVKPPCGVLPKPFTPDELLTVVRRCVKQHV